jgi:enediyne biosynthesis protein E8
MRRQPRGPDDDITRCRAAHPVLQGNFPGTPGLVRLFSPRQGGHAVPSDTADELTMTLEAFADTIVPGEKRSPDDRAIAGVAEGGGAVVAGAVELLHTDAAGVREGLPNLVVMLNGHAREYAAKHGVELDDDVPPFVSFDYDQRVALISELVAPGHPEKDGWVALALFSNMAFDTGAHMPTSEAIAKNHPGLVSMGFFMPDEDGLWRFPQSSYGRPLARLHPNTSPTTGSLA